MKEKRGFTLIELLAVIVILAIIALIATPIVLSLIDKARHGAAEDSAYGVRKEAQLLYQTTMMGRTGSFNKIEVDFSKTMEKDGKTYVETKLYETASSAGETNKVFFEADGTMPTNGKITINGDGTINYDILTISNYYCCIPAQGKVTCAKENNFDGNCGSSGDSSTPSPNPLPSNIVIPETGYEFDHIIIGTSVTIANEPFKVIWSNSSETALLADYSLNVGEYLYQENDVTVSAGLQNSHVIGFDSSNRYGSVSYDLVPESLNNYKNYLNGLTNNIIKEMRLLTISEASDFDCDSTNYICNYTANGRYDIIKNYGSFWLNDSYAEDDDYAWFIDNNNLFSTDRKSENRWYSIRPVVIINTSLLLN